MDDASKRAAIRRIADVVGIPIDEMCDIKRDDGPGDAELVKVARAFSRITDTRMRQLYLDALEASADRDGP